ncbi:MAG TPA: hypothetical protein VFE62_21505 [Gemmataceae bacterium]|nr:hypothetical protein [Gemmataceae bacterium]
MRSQLLTFVTLAMLVQNTGAQAPDLSLKPEDPASPVHPRRFGLPGGIGQTRGWYVWHKFDAKTWQAEVSHEQTGEKYNVRVLPWLTTYRHLAYGAHPDELLPGERVNLFFNPDDKEKRAYLVHFQDELCQMKGHNHAWQIEKVRADGFDAKVMAGDKEFDDGKIASFAFDAKCKIWHGGKIVEKGQTKPGERVYLTWVYAGKRRIVKLLCDATGLDAIQAEERKRIEARVKAEGMTAFVEEATPDQTRVLVFATWWQQAAALKPGDTLRLKMEGSGTINAKLVSRKNLGTYGSGCSELIVNGIDAKQLAIVRGWVGSKVVRVFGP